MSKSVRNTKKMKYLLGNFALLLIRDTFDTRLDVASMGVALSLGLFLLLQTFLLECLSIGLDTLEILASSIVVPDSGAFMRMVLNVTIARRVLDLENGGLVGSRGLAVGRLPLVRRSSIVDVRKLLLGGAGRVQSLGSTTSKQVTTNDAKVGKELSSLRVGGEERQKCAKVLDGFLTVPFSIVLLNRDNFAILLRASKVGALGVVNEVLEEFVGILLGDNETSLKGDISQMP
jgi:hypothetical protein